MFWCAVTLFIIYISIKWYLRSLWIRRNYGDLYVLVTGCDSGFGLEFMFKLHELGFNIFATCLNEKNAADLDKTTLARIRTVKLDVRDTGAISKLYQMVKDSIPKDKGKSHNTVSHTPGLTSLLEFHVMDQNCQFQRNKETKLIEKCNTK